MKNTDSMEDILDKSKVLFKGFNKELNELDIQDTEDIINLIISFRKEFDNLNSVIIETEEFKYTKEHIDKSIESSKAFSVDNRKKLLAVFTVFVQRCTQSKVSTDEVRAYLTIGVPSIIYFIDKCIEENNLKTNNHV